jgi:hypothetical protein
MNEKINNLFFPLLGIPVNPAMSEITINVAEKQTILPQNRL